LAQVMYCLDKVRCPQKGMTQTMADEAQLHFRAAL
jgi:hypothetical protein